MSGIGLRVDMSGLEGLRERLAAIGGFPRGELLAAVGATVESQTRRRITDEKTSPDGEKWPAWSPAYAATRHGEHSLLEGEGHLVDSIGYEVSGDQVEIGTNLVYGRAHQEGADFSTIRGRRHVKIPARPYLGLSADNESELEAVILDWFRELTR